MRVDLWSRLRCGRFFRDKVPHCAFLCPTFHVADAARQCLFMYTHSNG